MKERHLTVYEAPVWELGIPQIRLQGKWLNLLGFTKGKKIRVSCDNGKITIELESITKTNSN